MSDSNPFFLRKIIDYWDSRDSTIERFGTQLDEMNPCELVAAERMLSAAVTEHARVMPDDLLCHAAVFMADDLYRSAVYIPFWSGGVDAYLRATAQTFGRLLRERGFCLHYAVDNTFPNMDRPRQLLPPWYAACGFLFECPQVRLCDGGLSPSEAIEQTKKVLQATLAERRNYCLLDTEGHNETFAVFTEQIDKRDVISIFRQEAPIADSKIAIWLKGQRFSSGDLIPRIPTTPSFSALLEEEAEDGPPVPFSFQSDASSHLPLAVGADDSPVRFAAAEVDRFFNDSSIPVPGETPQAAIVAGGIAVGKTTMRKEKFATGYVVIDAVEIFLNLCKGEVLDFPGPLEAVMNSVGLAVTRRALGERRHLVLEFVASEALVGIVKGLKALGYSISLLQITCSVENAIERNAGRGVNDISAYYADPYQQAWLAEVCAELGSELA